MYKLAGSIFSPASRFQVLGSNRSKVANLLHHSNYLKKTMTQYSFK